MNEKQLWNTFIALKLHFTTDRYDVFEYKERTSYKFTELPLHRKIFLQKLLKQYDKRELVNYMISNFVSGDNNGGMFDQETGHIIYTKWKKTKESLFYTFKQDLNIIKEYTDTKNISINDVIVYNEGIHPILYKMYISKQISIETVVILDKIINFTEDYKESKDFFIMEFTRLVYKYSKFLKNNLDKFQKYYITEFNYGS